MIMISCGVRYCVLKLPTRSCLPSAGFTMAMRATSSPDDMLRFCEGLDLDNRRVRQIRQLFIKVVFLVPSPKDA